MRFGFDILRELKELIQHLSYGMERLSFEDNFEGFKATNISFPAGIETSVQNQLNYVPTSYIILSQTGNGLLTKGTTNWTKDKVYIINNGAVTVTATIFFLK